MKEQYKPQELPSCAIILNEDFPEDNEAELMQEVNKGRYVFYTQVDGEDGVVYYLKGVQNVNRTGIFALIPSTYRQAIRGKYYNGTFPNGIFGDVIYG